MAKQGIIFDMDGTLWDSSENVAKSWDMAVQEEAGGLRRITTKDVQAVMGHTMTEIAGMMFPMLSAQEANALVKLCCERENAYLRQYGGDLYPGLEETLRALSKRYPLYIVSNCQSGYIEAFLDYYGFEKYFQDMECFGNNKQGKAENIALVVSRNQLKQAVYVGDIQGDYDASMQAGVEFIHAAYGFGKIRCRTPLIHSLPELLEVVEEVLEQGLPLL